MSLSIAICSFGFRKMYNTTLDVNLMRKIKILAAQLDMRQNNLLEEAIRDLIVKYKHQEPRVSDG
jgi:predicted transcriptional regulator